MTEEEPIFLTLYEIKSIHEDQIIRYRGALGIRDRGGLDAALAMPQASFSGDFLHSDIPSMAAAYLYHIAMNHPFVDGNKRVATVSALVFLEMNGHEFDADEDTLEDTVWKLAAGDMGKNDLIEFFRKYAHTTNQ